MPKGLFAYSRVHNVNICSGDMEMPENEKSGRSPSGSLGDRWRASPAEGRAITSRQLAGIYRIPREPFQTVSRYLVLVDDIEFEGMNDVFDLALDGVDQISRATLHQEIDVGMLVESAFCQRADDEDFDIH